MQGHQPRQAAGGSGGAAAALFPTSRAAPSRHSPAARTITIRLAGRLAKGAGARAATRRLALLPLPRPRIAAASHRGALSAYIAAFASAAVRG